jgi:DNA-binding MarR family transcriptional regulator
MNEWDVNIELSDWEKRMELEVWEERMALAGRRRANGPDTIATRARRTEWLVAMRWRRRVETALLEAGLTFTQWLVLNGARELIEKTHDAVSQKEVAAHVELDCATISHVMTTLDRKNLVSRAPDLYGKAWRIWLCTEAERRLDELRAHIEAISSSGRPKADAEVGLRDSNLDSNTK